MLNPFKFKLLETPLYSDNILLPGRYHSRIISRLMRDGGTKIILEKKNRKRRKAGSEGENTRTALDIVSHFDAVTPFSKREATVRRETSPKLFPPHPSLSILSKVARRSREGRSMRQGIEKSQILPFKHPAHTEADSGLASHRVTKKQTLYHLLILHNKPVIKQQKTHANKNPAERRTETNTLKNLTCDALLRARGVVSGWQGGLK